MIFLFNIYKHQAVQTFLSFVAWFQNSLFTQYTRYLKTISKTSHVACIFFQHNFRFTIVTKNHKLYYLLSKYMFLGSLIWNFKNCISLFLERSKWFVKLIASKSVLSLINSDFNILSTVVMIEAVSWLKCSFISLIIKSNIG